MRITFYRLIFSFSGRIPRSTFWWTVILLGLAFVVLSVFLGEELGHASTLALYPPSFWVLAASAVKRMHDRGKSPAWLLIALIPILGPLWLFIELGLRKGNSGENQYGPDPLELDSDYLIVNIAGGGES
jgi:uncharacterized membrane protein YhaH (DUF805 family)